MHIDGDRLVVSIESDLSEVLELAEFVKPRLEYIEGIDIEEENPTAFGSSALFGLLYSLKKTNPNLEIPIFDQGLEIENYGKFIWSSDE